MKIRIVIYFIQFLSSVNLLFAQDIQVVAHRGGVHWGPENTLATIGIAIDKGVDYIEMDVRQTKDGVFVLMHDQSVSRTTNGSGNVSELSWDEIKDLDAGSWYSDEYTNEPIPKLRDVLKAINGKVLPDLDFKSGDPKLLVQLLKEEGFLDGRPLTLYSGDPQLIKEIQQLTDQIRVRPSIKSTYGELLSSINPPIVNLSWRKYSRKIQQRMNLDGKLSFVNCLFFANRKRPIKKAIQLGANFIQTDKLDFLLDQLNR